MYEVLVIIPTFLIFNFFFFFEIELQGALPSISDDAVVLFKIWRYGLQ